MKLITVLPDVVKSPKLTADWENALALVAKGEYSMEEFMDGIADMVLSVKLDAPAPCRLDAPDLDLIYYASADCLHQHLQVI